MIRHGLRLGACLLVAACSTSVPDSNPETGVGFGSYDSYAIERARREAELSGMGRGSAVPEGPMIASETVAVLNATRAPGASLPPAAPPDPGAPIETAASAIATQPIDSVSSAGISDEQSFDAVAARETIESDAERLARNREQYQVIQPTALPERAGGGGPNIVQYAISTRNNVGERLYRRSGLFSETRFNRACAKYPSPDLAQQAFLEAGGPERDRLGVDPDGDGFACFWDPSPFRAARRS